jgi:hypothetical protein
MCLNKLSLKLEGASENVAFPYMIGCGLAGGNWKIYLGMITNFADRNPNLNVFIYKLDIN